MAISENDATNSPATENRRVSQRAVRAPEKFVPDAPSSRSGNANGKRKRGADDAVDDVENGAEDEDEEENDEEEEDESADEEETRQVKRRTKPNKKPVAKKAKVNGTAPSTSAPVVKLPTRQRKTKKVAIEDPNAEGLYAEIFTSGDSSRKVAEEWLKRYQADNTASMTDLVNCILKSAGCDLKVTEDDVNDPDNIPSKLNDMQDEYRGQNAADYPLISKSKGSHAFRVSLVDFFESLVASMHTSGVLYDDIALIENIQLWVTTMSSSFLRPFRHTATVIALAITTSLCKTVKVLAKSTADALTMKEGEKKKKKSNKDTIAGFQQQVDQGNERIELCENTIKDFFDTVFVHRYRDVDAKVRTDCVEALGEWMVISQKMFIEGTYLRYLGWMLSDPIASTRHESVKQLEKIIKKAETMGSLREFIERFRPRVIEIARQDVDIGVRVSAVDLLDLFREAGMLEPDDIDVIGKLIFDTEPRVRKAVVGFFVENIKDLYDSKIEELGGEEALEDAFPEDDEDHGQPSAQWIKLKCLADVLLNYDANDEESPSQVERGIDNDTVRAFGNESRFSLAAQALYDKTPEIRDWNVLASYLLFDHSTAVDPKSRHADMQQNLRESFRLEEEEEAILLEVLEAAVKLSLALSEEHDKAKERSKKKLSKAEIKEMQESIARQLALMLPRLLSKFGANPRTTAAVLRLEQHINLEVFQTLRMDKTAYPKLLNEIGVQFKGHSDQRVLNEARAALEHARQYEGLEAVTEESTQSLLDDVTEDMRIRFHNSAKSAGFTARGDLSIELLTEFANTVNRVSELARIMNIVERFEKSKGSKSKRKNKQAGTVPIDILIEIISRGVLKEADADIDDIEDALVSSACRSAQFYFMWKLHSLRESISASRRIPDEDVDALKHRLDAFREGLFNVISSRGGLDDLRLLTTGTLLELHVLYSSIAPPQKSNSDATKDDQYAYLQPLSQPVSASVQEEITSIFTALEKSYAKKAHKSLSAPDLSDAPEDIDSEPSDDEDEDSEAPESERAIAVLKAEQKLCELTSKLVLAIVAGVIDSSGSAKGKLRARIQRNRAKLGGNFKEVVAYLDEDVRASTAGKGKKSHKSKAQQAAAAAKEAAKKSAEVVEVEEDVDQDEEDEDPFADIAPEDGEEALDEEVPRDGDEEEDERRDRRGVDDDDIMGD